jgi:hypothetical protein
MNDAPAAKLAQRWKHLLIVHNTATGDADNGIKQKLLTAFLFHHQYLS